MLLEPFKKTLVSAKMKESHLTHLLKRKDANPDFVFKIPAANPLVFIVGSSSGTKISMPKDKDAIARNDQALKEGDVVMSTVETELALIPTPLRNISNEPPNLKGSVEDPVATASLKISIVVLKRIDPKLRPSARGNSEASSDQVVALVNHEAVSDVSPNSCQHDESINMQVNDGGEFPTFI